MIVVSDASPIIALATVGHLGLLRELYEEILIPTAVATEILAAKPNAPGVAEVRAAEWIQSREVTDRILVNALHLDVDSGEAEAIGLSLEIGSELLLMDERRARAIARRMGCSVVGVLGVLIEAKSKSHLEEVRPVLDALDAQAGFRLSRALYAEVVRAAAEE